MNYYQNKPIKTWALEDRPREKMVNRGVGALTDAELVAILLSTGTKEHSALDLGRILIERFGDLGYLARASPEDLMKTKGIGRAKAITLVTAFEVGRRKLNQERNAIYIRSSKDAADYISPKLADLRTEQFYLIMMNQNNEVLGHKLISAGGITSTIVDVRMLYKEALDKLACGIVIAHNHPSGNTRPSDADEDLTGRIYRAGKLLDIRLIDHLIITHQNFYSFSDSGKMEDGYQRIHGHKFRES